MNSALTATPPTTNKHLIRWVEKMADLCQPAEIHWVDGSDAENENALRQASQGRYVSQIE